METCKIFSPNDKAVILVKSMRHCSRQWDRMQKSRLEKLSKVILASRLRRELHRLEPGGQTHTGICVPVEIMVLR